jgi:hypothetical protein
MAQLPPDGTWLVQEIDGTVMVFHRYTEETLARFDPGDPASVEKAFQDLAPAGSPQLDDEARCFAYFWAGYFAGYAGYPLPPEDGRVSYDKSAGQVVILLGGEPPMLHTYAASDRDMTAQAQSVIHFAATVPDEAKPMTHFWCGYFWATASGEGD